MFKQQHYTLAKVRKVKSCFTTPLMFIIYKLNCFGAQEPTSELHSRVTNKSHHVSTSQKDLKASNMLLLHFSIYCLIKPLIVS